MSGVSARDGDAANKIQDVFPWGTVWPPPLRSGNFCGEETEGPGLRGKLAGFNDGFPFTAPVGSFSPNLLGLHDLAGNVREWCYERVDRTVMQPPTRGGAFINGDAEGLLSSHRIGIATTSRHPHLGFRVVLAPTR